MSSCNNRDLPLKIIKIDRETLEKEFSECRKRIIKDNIESADKYGRPSNEDMQLRMTI